MSWVRGGRSLGLGLVLAGVSGCGVGPTSPPLVVATSWPASLRAQAERLYHQQAGVRRIEWVSLGPRLGIDLTDRRGGVDLILGSAPRDLLPLLDAGRLALIEPNDSVPWRIVDPPIEPTDRRLVGSPPVAGLGECRDDPAAEVAERRVLATAGWERGWATLVRQLDPRALGDRTGSVPLPQAAVLARVRSGRHPDQAARLAAALTAAGWIQPAPASAERDARAEDLLADLLASTLRDAHPERRTALEALNQFGQPALAASALDQRPPWPPASVARLLAEPGHGPLVEALLTQLTPDRATRDWLRTSWNGPRGVVDPPLLAAIASAADGRLAREPRFRAWLRGEWTASMQQHYRRVARLARGYRPS